MKTIISDSVFEERIKNSGNLELVFRRYNLTEKQLIFFCENYVKINDFDFDLLFNVRHNYTENVLKRIIETLLARTSHFVSSEFTIRYLQQLESIPVSLEFLLWLKQKTVGFYQFSDYFCRKHFALLTTEEIVNGVKKGHMTDWTNFSRELVEQLVGNFNYELIRNTTNLHVLDLVIEKDFKKWEYWIRSNPHLTSVQVVKYFEKLKELQLPFSYFGREFLSKKLPKEIFMAMKLHNLISSYKEETSLSDEYLLSSLSEIYQLDQAEFMKLLTHSNTKIRAAANQFLNS